MHKRVAHRWGENAPIVDGGETASGNEIILIKPLRLSGILFRIIV